MAIYYVRTNGSDANTGLGQGTAQAWLTINKALSATGMASGDTVYVAPGVYATQISVGMTSATTTTTIMGDPTASQFTGVTAGNVIVTNYDTPLTGVSFTGTIITAVSKNNLSWNKLFFKVQNTSAVNVTLCRYWSFTDCNFQSRSNLTYAINFTPPASQPFDHTFLRCTFVNGASGIYFVAPSSLTSQIADTTSIKLCQFVSLQQFCIHMQYTGGFTVFNCTMMAGYGIYMLYNSSLLPTIVKNCLINSSNQDLRCDGGSNAIVEDYNRLLGFVARLNCIASVPSNTSTAGDIGLDFWDSVFFGLPSLQPITSYSGSLNKQFGITAGAPTNDIYGVAWTGTSPDAGSATYRLMSTVSPYNPTERNASVITIPPDSTSQSIELYLGATGLTSSTSGLAARYNRTRTASVSIPLVARTIAQAWTSGGFAEVDSTNMPGVYRLDLPDAALAAGADDVTIVVRGASGTNGAVMTVKLYDILSADIGGGTNAGTLNERTVRSALRAMRNKVVVSTGNMTVFKEDDTNTAWTGTLSSTADITVDPA